MSDSVHPLLPLLCPVSSASGPVLRVPHLAPPAARRARTRHERRATIPRKLLRYQWLSVDSTPRRGIPKAVPPTAPGIAFGTAFRTAISAAFPTAIQVAIQAAILAALLATVQATILMTILTTIQATRMAAAPAASRTAIRAAIGSRFPVRVPVAAFRAPLVAARPARPAGTAALRVVLQAAFRGAIPLRAKAEGRAGRSAPRPYCRSKGPRSESESAPWMRSLPVLWQTLETSDPGVLSLPHYHRFLDLAVARGLQFVEVDAV